MAEEREMFSVEPGTTLEEVLELADREIDFAMRDGAYAAPEIWFSHIPALVALLKFTTAELKKEKE